MAIKKPELLVLLAFALGIPLSAADEASPSLQPMAEPSGSMTLPEGTLPDGAARKSGPQPGFAADCPIVQMGWSIPASDNSSARKPSTAYSEFAADELTELKFQFPLRQEELKAVPEVQPPTDRKADRPVNKQVLSDLMSLLKPSDSGEANSAAPVPAASEPAASEVSRDAAVIPNEHYLADLQSLVNQDSAWIKLNRGYTEAHSRDVAKATPVYMAELQELSSRIQRFRPTSARRVQSLSGNVTLSPTAAPGSEAPLDRLFAPMTSVKIHGTSSEQSSREDSWRVPLDDPRSTASTNAVDYFHGGIPAYYVPSMRYAVTRPNRALYPFRNNPLYFEDPNLERCGIHSDCLTNFWSIGHFAFNTAILPYRLAAQPPCTCVPSLGDCPSCNEYDSTAYLPPWSWAGLVAETGVITGLVFIIP